MEVNELVTKADILQLKTDLLSALSEVMNRSSNVQKRWLKSNEVMELLSLSSSGLQNLRINGTIPFTKLGGAHYYDYQEILKILEANKSSK